MGIYLRDKRRKGSYWKGSRGKVLCGERLRSREAQDSRGVSGNAESQGNEKNNPNVDC